MILSFFHYGEWEDYYVASQTSPDKEYLVIIDREEETVYCTCPDFQYRKQTEKFGGAKLSDTSNHCKHIKEVISYEEKGGNCIRQATYNNKGTVVSNRV